MYMYMYIYVCIYTYYINIYIYIYIYIYSFIYIYIYTHDIHFNSAIQFKSVNPLNSPARGTRGADECRDAVSLYVVPSELPN